MTFAQKIAAFAVNRVNPKPAEKRIRIAFVICAVFALMLLLNFLMPWAHDDYTYLYSLADGSRITSFGDVIQSQIAHYSEMNGRFLVNTILQTLLIFPKPVYDVFASLMFVGLLLLMYYHAFGSFKKFRLTWFVLSFFGLWFFVRAFGTVFLWAAGGANTLFGFGIALAALIPFRHYDRSQENNKPYPVLKSVCFSLLCLIGGFCAGQSYEQCAALFITISFCYTVKWIIQKRKLRMWMFTAFAGAWGGFASIMISPAQQSRVETVSSGGNPLFNFAFECGRMLQDLSVFVVVFVALAILICMSKKGALNRVMSCWSAAAYLVAAPACILPMIFIARSYTRFWGVPVVLCIIAVGRLYAEMVGEKAALGKVKPGKRSIIGVAAAVLLCAGGFTFIGDAAAVIYDDIELHNYYNEIELSIAEQKAAGVTDIMIPAKIDMKTKFHPFQTDNITSDPSHWINTGMAKYYGVNSITGYLPGL
jgi:hypothetical protein